jgi:hypothetical protein
MARFRSIADAIPASVPAGESEVPAAIEVTMIGRAKERSVEPETSSPECVQLKCAPRLEVGQSAFHRMRGLSGTVLGGQVRCDLEVCRGRAQWRCF